MTIRARTIAYALGVFFFLTGLLLAVTGDWPGAKDEFTIVAFLGVGWILGARDREGK